MSIGLYTNFSAIFILSLGIFSILYYTYVFRKGKMRISALIYGYKFCYKDKDPKRFLFFVIFGLVVGIICMGLGILMLLVAYFLR